MKGRPLRGIQNRCMLCSEKELGISDEHEGILIMAGDYTPGTPLQDVLGDAVISIDIIPNIARCASIVGVAREVAALTGQQMRYPSYDVVMEGPSAEGKVVITTEQPELNPRFTAFIITGVEQKPSPAMDAAPPPFSRTAPHQRRRRHLQLRHAGNGRTQPHLRL